MTGHQSQFSPSNTQEGRWRCWAEIALPSPLDNERLALTAIIQALQALGLPTTFQERLKTALVESVVRAVAFAGPHQPAFPVLVRLLVSQSLLDQDTSKPGGDHPMSQSPSSDAVNLTDLPPPNGWGSFLVERSIGEILGTGQAIEYVVELFLYQEGEGG